MRKGSIQVTIGGQDWFIGVREARSLLASIKAQLKTEEDWPYDPDIAKEILAQVAEGRLLEDICHPPFPPPDVFLTWCKNEPELYAAYQEAQVRQADNLFDRIHKFAQEIAGRLKAGDQLSTSEVNTYRVLLDTLRWMCAKLNPSKFADYQRVGMETQIGWRIIYKGICEKCGKDLLPPPTLAISKAPPKLPPVRQKKEPTHPGQAAFIKKLGGLTDDD